MHWDVRVPIGVMFVILGVVLVVFGLLTSGSAVYERSLGLNVNLWWGLLLFLFGAGMLAWATWGSKPGPRPPPQEPGA